MPLAEDKSQERVAQGQKPETGKILNMPAAHTVKAVPNATMASGSSKLASRRGWLHSPCQEL